MYSIGLVQHPSQYTQTRTYRQISRWRFLTPITDKPLSALFTLSHAFTQRDSSPDPWLQAVASPEQKQDGGRGPRLGFYLLRDNPPQTQGLSPTSVCKRPQDPSMPRAPSSPLPRLGPSLGHTPFHSYTQPNKETDPQSGFKYRVSLRVSNSNGRRSQECPLPSLQTDTRVGASK